MTVAANCSRTESGNAIVKQWGTLVGLLFLFLLISQFLAYFNYSNIPAVTAVGIGHALEHVHVPAVWLLILFIIIVTIVNLILAGAIPKWAILAPIFIPVFPKLNVNRRPWSPLTGSGTRRRT